MGSLQIGLIVAGIVGTVVLLAMLINLFRQMTRLALAVGTILAMVLVIIVAVSLIEWPTLPSVWVDVPFSTTTNAPIIPRPSAAVTVRWFVMGMLVVVVLLPVLGMLGYFWWQAYQRRVRLQDTREQAKIYALMSGQQMQSPAGTMGRRMGQPGGTVIMVGGQQQEMPAVGGDLWDSVE